LKSSEGLVLELLDDQGRIINKLANGLKANTSHRFTINRTGLTSGIYIIRLITKDKTISQKVIIQ
jgi:hypothetical protein